MDRDKELITIFIVEFNEWAKSSYIVEAWPDVETRDRKAVDAIARDALGRDLAVEHTLLQPFLGDREDTVPFLKVAGRLDRRADLAEPNWMIDLVFEVGAVRKGVDWEVIGQRLEAWFVAVRSTLPAGRSVHNVDQLSVDLSVTVNKSPHPNSVGKLFVMRTMPDEPVEPVLRAALAAKVPKLAATQARGRILLLEMDSPVRGYWEVGEAIEALRVDFPGLEAISSVWIARTVAWQSEGYIGFHLIWPLDNALEYQEWYRREA